MPNPKTVLGTIDPTKIDAIIEEFLEEKISQAGRLHPHYQDLWTEVARLLRAGGKRLRSHMVILAYEMFGGKDSQAVLPAAVAQELLHIGMLIHDDIIDRDYVRYGVDNIVGGYTKRYSQLVTDESERGHYAGSAALLAGDLMISEAYMMMAESQVEPSKILDIQRLLGQSIFEVIGGELIDVEATFRGADSATPETIAHHKTASYSFILPLLVGAQLANAPQADQQQIRLFGRSLGIAFQLRDDIIGMFGNTAETGKSSTGDIREGKRTYMVEQFDMLATKEQRATFKRHYGDPSVEPGQCAQIRELLRASGALEKTERTIANYEAEARTALKQLELDPAYIVQLDELIGVAARRTR